MPRPPPAAVSEAPPSVTFNLLQLSLTYLFFPESSSAPPPALPPEEEEEEEQEVEGEGEDDVPDLTSFSIDDMKQ